MTNNTSEEPTIEIGIGVSKKEEDSLVNMVEDDLAAKARCLNKEKRVENGSDELKYEKGKVTSQQQERNLVEKDAALKAAPCNEKGREKTLLNYLDEAEAGVRQSLRSVQARPPSPTCNTTPGAYPQRGTRDTSAANGPNEVSTLTFNEEVDVDTLVDTTEPMDASEDADLVQANLVRPSQYFSTKDLEVAEPLEEDISSRQQERESKSKYFNGRCLLGLGVILLVVVVAITVVATMPSKPHQLESDGSNTREPPSMAPIDAFLALLPSSTQEIILNDPDHDMPQTKAYQWVLNDPGFMEHSDARLLQRFALATFYYSTNGRNWKHQGGGTITALAKPPPLQPGVKPSRPTTMNVTSEKWLDYEAHECSWLSFHTMCPTDNETVQELDLASNALSGTLPVELTLLTALRFFGIPRNNVQGTLMTEFGSFTNLQILILPSNQFKGTVPSELGLLSNTLKELTIIDNQVVGSLPSQIWALSNLKYLRTSRNDMTGTLPDDVCFLLPKLKSVGVDKNQLWGTMPSSLNKCKDLTAFEARENELTGPIPTEIGLLDDFQALRLGGNQLTGTVPSQLALVSSLRVLTLGENPGISGTIPTELNHSLSELDIAGTSITGTITPALCETGRLTFDCSATLCGCSCPCA